MKAKMKSLTVLSGLLMGTAVQAVDLEAPSLISAGGTTQHMSYYSSVEVVDWNNDGKKDLLVGGGLVRRGTGRLKLFLNVGTDACPVFDSFTFLESNGVLINGFDGGS